MGLTNATRCEPGAITLPTVEVAPGSRPAPCTLVIFGGTGDLARRKLLPALYNPAVDGTLPKCAVVGFARNELTAEQYRTLAREGVHRFSRRPTEAAAWAAFQSRLDYVTGTFDDPGAYVRLKTRLGAIEREHGLPGNRLFYLAIPPSLIATCVRGLSAAGIVSAADDPRFTRVVVEKPIDRDLPSARQLNEVVAKAFAEGLPDRPLPRQGDRAEPPGPALRQHVSRAPLEQ